MKKTLALGLVVASLALAGNVAFAESGKGKGLEAAKKFIAEANMTPSVQLMANGKVAVEGVKVTGISGNNLLVSGTFSGTQVNGTIQTNASTEFMLKSGGKSSLSEISVGDVVNARGTVVWGSGATMLATSVRNVSVRENHEVSGTVSSTDAGTKSFRLGSGILVKLTDATKIMVGNTVGVFSDIKAGVRVSAKGILNSALNTLTASSVKVKAPEGMEKQTFEGTVKTAPGATAPTTMILTIGGADRTVRIASDTSILNNLWLRLGLSSIAAGDKVRVYGAMQADGSIDATVVRDVVRF